MPDRRENPRLVVALEARYQAQGSVLDHRATLSVLSAGGASFVTEEPLEPGLALDHLRFTLGEEPGLQELELAAEVVRCERREGIGQGEEFLIAVKFADPAPADADRIRRFVLERLARDNLAYNPRIDLEKPVAVRFERFDEFVQEVSKNLSKTGMFIRTDSLHPPGSEFEFVLQLGDDFSLVQGRAEVVWTRAENEGPDRPQGMGIRFLSLDKTSENVLRRLIESYIEPSYPRALVPPGTASPAPVDDSAEPPEAPDRPDPD